MTTNNGQRPPETITMPPPTTAVAVVQKSEAVQEFELMQRKAKMFAFSPLVPAHIRDNGSETGLANCYIALVLAEQMGENPLVVMQNIYIVHGRAGWSASYMIAKANASGVFKGVIRFKHSGEGDTRECTATGTLKDTGENVSVTVGMKMAKAEGWTKNAKYQSMPDQMLIYRAATFLVRTYCPQVMLGYRTADEIVDEVAAAVPDVAKLTIAGVTGEGEPAPVNRVAKALEETAPDAKLETKELRPDQLQFSGLLARFEKAGGDPDAWLFEQNLADKAKALEVSKPALSKLISGLTKACDEREAAAKAFAGKEDGMAAVRA